ncbi:hypothetical protein [Streptomyces virginiae]
MTKHPYEVVARCPDPSPRVEPGGTPGSFRVATSNREVMMKPGERYMVAIGPGDLEARPGTTTFAH